MTAAALLLTLASLVAPVHAAGAAQPAAAPASNTPLKIGIIGTGEIGGTLATLWVKAGHEVLMSLAAP